jgi:hexosaminidase
LFLIVIILSGSLIKSFAIQTIYSIVPYPEKIEPKSGEFILNPLTVIYCSSFNTELNAICKQFRDQFARSSGIFLEIRKEKLDTALVNNAIVFSLKNIADSNEEAYELCVSKRKIVITSNSTHGAFNALQTLYQLMPVTIYSNKEEKQKKWSVNCVSIKDKPRFSYRGLHLDVSRHLFPVQSIKKYIDAMAMHKYNVLHWHLTDDQGWRIEIKKFPKLTKVGGFREQTLVGHYYDRYPQKFDKKAYGGFYTQQEAKEIVEYAKSKFIIIIPEIEMPGHAQAAIAAYPFLSCNQSSKINVATNWGVYKDVFCTREDVFRFLEGVLTEVIEIFPSKYIHIGGDECHKDRWRLCPDCQERIQNNKLKNEKELQSYFIRRIGNFLHKYDRQIIGWDEILDGEIPSNAVIMSWRGIKPGIDAAKAKHNVIMTPMSNCYFDKYQADPTTSPKLQSTAIGGFLPLKMVYDYEPIPSELSIDERKYIIGAQANVWTEYMPTFQIVERMVYPRAAAMSEVLWTTVSNKDWNRFKSNMIMLYSRYEKIGIQPSFDFYNVQFSSSISNDRNCVVQLACDYPNVQIRYTKTAKVPTMNDSLYTKPIVIHDSVKLTAVAFHNGRMIGSALTKRFVGSKLTGLNCIKTLSTNVTQAAQRVGLTDGIVGTTGILTNWVEITKGDDGEVIFDLEKSQLIHHLSIGMLNAPSICAIVPTRLQLFGSLDGSNYVLISDTFVSLPGSSNWEIIRPNLVFPSMMVRYLKLKIKKPYPCTTTKMEGNDGVSTVLFDEVMAW